MYQLVQTGAGQEDPRFMSQERVMAYLQSQGLLSAQVGEGNPHDQQPPGQQHTNPDTGGFPVVHGTLSEAQQAAMFRAMWGMHQQQPDAHQKGPPHSSAQDPGIWLADDGDGAQEQMQNNGPLHHDQAMGLNDIEYDYSIGPSTAPPSLNNPNFVHMHQDMSGYRFGQGDASESQTPQTAPIQGYAHDFSLEMQRQQQEMLGNQFSVYRSPHLASTTISPGPSPLLAPQQIVVPVSELAGESLDLQQLGRNQALAQAQYQAQMQMHGHHGGSVSTPSGFRNNLAVEAMVRRHSHQRNSSAPSSYAGSVHSGLEGLEEQFLSVTGLGQFTENAAESYDNPADDYETSDFGGKEASGLLDVEQFMDMDGGVENIHSVIASKGSSGDESDLMNAISVKEEPVFGVWTTVQHGEDSPTQDGNLWQEQVDSGIGLPDEQIMFAEPSLVNAARSASGLGDRYSPAQHMTAPHRMIAALDASGTSEFGRRMNSVSSTRTPSTSSSISASNNPGRRTASPLNNTTDGTGRALPTRSTTLDSNEGFPMPPFQTQSTSSPGSGGSGSNSPVPFFSQPQRVKHLSGPQAKPHSPPQLFIPDTSSPSPSVKPAQLYPSRGGLKEGARAMSRESTSGYTHQPGQMTLGIPTGGNMGGHTGSGSFLSPIGPGGPSINIVPSTPTSGLREARGIWEKLAIQAQKDQHAQHHQSGLSDQPAGTIPAPQGPPRRASHAGIYVPVTIDEGIALSNQAANQVMPPQPPPVHHAQYGLPAHMLVTPPLRQRTRSEGAISAMVSEFGMQDLQEQWPERKQSDKSIDPRMLMGESAISSRSTTPGMGPSLVEMQGMVYMGPNGVPVYVPRQGVVPGPEVLGANFIVTNDGRRLSFDSRLERAPALFGPDASDPATGPESGRPGTHVKQEDFDAFLTSMIVPGDNGAQLKAAPSGPHRRQVKSEDWGRPAHMVDPSR